MMRQLLLQPWFLGIFGLLVGSFLNVVIHRLPRMMQRGWMEEAAALLQDDEGWKSATGQAQPAGLAEAGRKIDQALESLPACTLVRPRSRCPHCGHLIRWYENIPVLSWLALRGRCSSCKAGISWRYPFVELLTGAGFAWVGMLHGGEPLALLYCGLVAALVALAGIDWDTTLLPDSLNQPLLWAGLLVAGLGWGGIGLSNALAGAVGGYLSLWSIYWLFKLTTGKDGMGQGDFKLLAALGAWLGWQALLPIVLMSSVIGAFVGIGLKVAGGLREGRYVPFGPFLAGGGLVVLFAGLPRVLGWMGW
ncbi:prepilin peptidase [Ideonella sp. TBM-1]|uniref:Prepilin leader peptidase/N-methyltransferase n=1 Tax=Ideonella livida TaxID=2707176 RepID=A0A7C9TNC1_9BURK|nr:prepilin peptidase [Ideonella livida]